jgi:phosphoadenosine phosphosulfate reductase
MVKVNPIAAWTQDDVDAYVAEHGVLVNPLAYDGYPSIGCARAPAASRRGRTPAPAAGQGRARPSAAARLTQPWPVSPL